MQFKPVVRAVFLYVLFSSPSPVPPVLAVDFFRGDSTADGAIDITDAVKILFHVFEGQTIFCQDAADADDSGNLELADAVFIFSLLYNGGPLPSLPFPDCGEDVTVDDLDCLAFEPCVLPDNARLGPEGGTLVLEDELGRTLSVNFSPGVFDHPTAVFASFSQSPAPLLDDLTPTLLPLVALIMDGGRIDSTKEGGRIELVFPESVVDVADGGAAFLDDVTVFVEVHSRRYFYTFLLETFTEDGDSQKKRVSIPTSIFQKAREWSLIGRESMVEGSQVTIEEVLRGGRVRLSEGDDNIEGTLSFEDGGRTAVIGTVINNRQEIIEIALPPTEVRLEFAISLARTLYSRVQRLWTRYVGEGRLFKVTTPELALESSGELLGEFAVNEHAPIVLVHGWDLLDPFHDMFRFTSSELAIQDFTVPRTEDEFLQLVQDYWRPALVYLNRPSASGIYLYTYNPLRSLEENAAFFASEMRRIFGWADRKSPMVFLTQSTGGLLVSTAFDQDFGLGTPLPPHLRQIALNTPFRGTPLANPSFQEHWLGNDLAEVFGAAHPLWLNQTLEVRRLFPVELIGSTTAIVTFFRSAAPATRDLDLDAVWDTMREEGLDNNLFRIASEWNSNEQPWQYRILNNLLGSFTDFSGQQPYSRSDGVVPIASSLRRRGLTSDFWFSVEPTALPAREIHLSGFHHLSLRGSQSLFERLGLGVGSSSSVGNLESVYLPPGSFLLGSPEEERGRAIDEPLHRVNISRGFYIGVSEVTQAQYETVTGENPSFYQGEDGDPGHPVERVSWKKAVEFCCRLTELNRAEGRIRQNERYRLPTEAEWEYACRAGSTSPFYFGEVSGCVIDACGPCPSSDLDIWWCGNSGRQTHDVMEKRPNSWNLFDMHGNVAEWCKDTYGTYLATEVNDPQGGPTGPLKVFRGGSWFEERLQNCRSAYRGKTLEGTVASNVGFRVVLAVEAEGDASFCERFEEVEEAQE